MNIKMLLSKKIMTKISLKKHHNEDGVSLNPPEFVNLLEKESGDILSKLSRLDSDMEARN